MDTQVQTFPYCGTELTAIPMKAGVFLDTGQISDPTALDPEIILNLFHGYGAVVIGGLQVTQTNFARVTERIATDFVPYVGGRSVERNRVANNDQTIMTVTAGGTAKRAILPHIEMHYRAAPPATMFFCCVTPAETGGETTLIDGVALWNDLPQRIQKILEENRITYHRRASAKDWQRLYQTDDPTHLRQICEELGLEMTLQPDGLLETKFTVAPVRNTAAGKAFYNNLLVWLWNEMREGEKDAFVRMESGAAISSGDARAIFRAARDLTEAIPWQQGDLAIVDNRRVLHGRNAYDDPRRDIILRMARDPLPPPAKRLADCLG